MAVFEFSDDFDAVGWYMEQMSRRDIHDDWLLEH